MVFIKVLVYLNSATCTMNLQNPKNGSKLPSRDFANPPNRCRQCHQKSLKKINMENFLLIASFLALHNPFGLFRDTARRFENFAKYGSEDNFLNYCLKNNIDIYEATKIKFNMTNSNNPILKLPLVSISMIISSFFALLPLFKLLSWKWYFIVLLNIVFTFVISQILAFIITPRMKIYDISQLYIRTAVYTLIGLLFYGISFLF